MWKWHIDSTSDYSAGGPGFDSHPGGYLGKNLFNQGTHVFEPFRNGTFITWFYNKLKQ